VRAEWQAPSQRLSCAIDWETCWENEVIIYWSEDDGAFVAEIPELPGCAADGKTQREALRNVDRVGREWIETARELGRPVPKPRGRLMFA
jgi:predicted RNase H-like HicB family nuclease